MIPFLPTGAQRSSTVHTDVLTAAPQTAGRGGVREAGGRTPCAGAAGREGRRPGGERGGCEGAREDTARERETHKVSLYLYICSLYTHPGRETGQLYILNYGGGQVY